MDDSPDCTGIFRMKKTFDDFMSLPSGNEDSLKTRLRFEPESKRPRFNHSSKSTTSLSMARLIEKEQEDRVKDAALIKARSRITSLESELVTLKTNKQRTQIELEEELQQMKIDRENDIRKLDDMRTKLKFLARSEEELRSEVNDGRKASTTIKQEYEQKLLSLQREKFEKESEYQQREDTTRQSLSKLRTEKCRTEAERNICQSELDEANERCDTLQKKVNGLLVEKNEFETLRIKAMNAEQKAGDLQRELATYHDDTIVVRALKEKISTHADIQRENRRLKDEVEALKRRQENALLKNEEIHSLNKQVEYMDGMRAEKARLEVENENLSKRLREWETVAGSKQPKSTSDFSRQIVELQSRLAVMLEKQGQLQASLNSAERLRQNAVDDLNLYKSRNRTEAGKTGEIEDYVKRLKKRMLLLTKERDGYRKTLDSLDGEMTSHIRSPNLTEARVQILEETIRDYNQHIEQLETQIRKKGEEVELWMKKAQPSIVPAQSRDDDLALIEKLRARVEELEVYMEHRNLKGDYDPTKTKVLHFRLNPSSIAQQEKAETVSKLREENERLRQAIQLLEEKQGEMQDLTQIIGVKVHEQPGTSKELEDAKSQLSSAELKNKRLMEMFSKTSREYREIYYMLTGYKVTINNHNVKVMNMYSEGPDEFLMFQYRDNTLNLMENEYTASVSDLMQQYLLQHGSIPSFLAALTLNLFSKQTILLS